MIVKAVHREDELDLRRLFPETYQKTVAEFQARGIQLPAWDNLMPQNKEDMQLLLSPLRLTVELMDGTALEYDFKPGYVTDLASVPPKLRSLVDNDNRHILLAAFVHDANYGGQLLPWGRSNSIFGDMIVEAGGSRWLSFKAWAAVSLPVAHRVYNRSTPEQRARETSFFTFSKGQPCTA